MGAAQPAPASMVMAAAEEKRRAQRALRALRAGRWFKWPWVNIVLGSHFGVGEITTHFSLC